MTDPASPLPHVSRLADLESRSDARLGTLIGLIESNSLEEASLGEAYLGRRGADVLTHLHGWHLQFLEWLRADAAGEEVFMPAPGYTWDDLRAYNDDLHERFRAVPYTELRDLVRWTHARTFEALDALGDDAVSDPARFPWAGRPLLEIADECTGKHYDWGIERVTEALGAA